MIIGVDRVPEGRSWHVRILDAEHRVIGAPTPMTPCDLALDEGVEVLMEAGVEDGASLPSDQVTVRLRAKRGALCPPYRLGRTPTGRGRTYDLIVYVTDAEQVEVA